MARRHEQELGTLVAATAPTERGEWRWLLVVGVMVAALAMVLVLDRTDRAEQASDAVASATSPTSPGVSAAPDGNAFVPDALPPVENFTQDGLPTQLSGTVYAVTDDGFLVELDLASGRGRRAHLAFQPSSWLVSQVVALQDTVLVASRRRVYAVDRATLGDQQQLATDRWVVAPPGGDWAALVPFGAGGGAVTVVDGAGMPRAEQPLVLPSGVEVQGALGDSLIIDHGGGLQLLGLDGVLNDDVGAGRFLAAGAETVARMQCQSLDCAVVTAAPGAAPTSEISGLRPAGPWLVGAGAVFDPGNRYLAAVAAAVDGSFQVEVHDTAGPAASSGRSSPVRTGPVPPRAAGSLPALAWSADRSTVVFASSQGLVLWRAESSGSDRSPDRETATVPMPGSVLSLTVTPDPPPPPPVGGPPPSFA